MTNLPTRWTVRQCAVCNELWPMRITTCQFCGLALPMIVTVVMPSDVGEDTAGLVSHNHGETANQAALEVRPRTGTQRRRVLDCIERAGTLGLTRDDIAKDLGMSPNAVRPRVRELLDGGHVSVDETGRGVTAMNRPAELLIAAKFARYSAGEREAALF